MARTSTYLNTARSTEEAFAFYKTVFGTEYASPIARFGDIPASPGQLRVAGDDKNLVMHVEPPTLGGGYFESLTDRFGVPWMVNRASKS